MIGYKSAALNWDRCICVECFVRANVSISCAACLIERLLRECVLNEVCQRLAAVLEAAVASERMKERGEAISYGSLPCEWEKVNRFVCMVHYLPITLDVCLCVCPGREFVPLSYCVSPGVTRGGGWFQCMGTLCPLKLLAATAGACIWWCACKCVWEASAVSLPQACCHTIISADKSRENWAAKSWSG